MSRAYQNPINAKKYLDFLASSDGRLQQQFLWAAIEKHLPENRASQILDCASGSGWLTKQIAAKYPNTQGCDNSEPLLNEAKKHCPNIKFELQDIEIGFAYENLIFDAVVLNMAAPDLSNLSEAFKNISKLMKQGAKLILTIPNPAFTYPVSEWKRGLLDILTFKKPSLKINSSYFQPGNVQREFKKGEYINSHFYTLADYFEAAKKTGLSLSAFNELKSPTDSPKFDLVYRLYRYPLILILVFIK